MRELLLLPSLFISMVPSALGQNTVGLLTNQASASQDGHTLFYPAGQGTAFLVDNCGRLVHTWTDEMRTPGNAAYLMENGDLVRCAKTYGEINPVIRGGGAGEMVDRRDWEGNTIWSFKYNSASFRMHHDVAMMPNGNVLIVAWELKTLEEAAQRGMDTVGFASTALWPDHVIEVEPIGVEEGNIVWEWHAWDHLIQDRSPDLPNFGMIAANPGRIDVNYHPVNDADWMHVNSIDYNPALDQILLTSPYFNEVWIIDHSTTTAEAATSSGGVSGRGGDLLYRWGNPAAYGRTMAPGQTLFFPHHARWLGPGLDPNDPDRGRIMVFNNRVGPNYSSVDVFTPPYNGTGYSIVAGQPYGPTSLVRRITGPDQSDMYSTGLSSAQKLPNGNVLICSGAQAWILEVAPDNEVVWEYLIPLTEGAPVAQGSSIEGTTVFMAQKYPADHPFLSTQELPTDAYIELEPNTAFCGSITVGEEPVLADGTTIHPNPASDRLFVAADQGVVTVQDLMGKVVLLENRRTGQWSMDVSGLAPGTYFVRVDHGPAVRLVISR